MGLVFMGCLSELYDLPETLVKRLQLGTFNRGDDDGDLSGRRGRERRGRAECDGKGSLRHQEGLDRGDIFALDSVAQGDVNRSDVPAATGKVLQIGRASC